MRIRNRKPSHPGNILSGLYIKPLSMTITELSKRIGVSRKAISQIINERKSVTPEMAVRLSLFFKTTPDLWLNLQKSYDLWQVMNSDKKFEIESFDAI